MLAAPRPFAVATLALLVASCAAGAATVRTPTDVDVEGQGLRGQLVAALVFSEAQLLNYFTRVPEEEGVVDRSYPAFTKDGIYTLSASREWTAGFFPALVWAFYDLHGGAEWKRRAEAMTLGLWTEAVSERAYNLGYKMLPFGEAYDLSGDSAWRRFAINGAATYAQRFDSTACVRSIPTWLPKDRVVAGVPLLHATHISGIVNAELLFRAAKQPGGDPRWHDLARDHCLNAARDHLRPNGSVYTTVDYHPTCPESGWRWRGNDGRADERTRARTQAYAIHGFALAFGYTAEARLLAAAKRAADYYLDVPTLPADGVPYFELELGPVSSEARDTSAAAMAALGFLELADVAALGAPDRARYRAAAERILGALSSRYLAHGQREGILTDAFLTVKPHERSTSVAVADYYFLKAIQKYLGHREVSCRAPVCELEAESAVRLDPPITRQDGPPAYIAGSTTGQGGRAELHFYTARAGAYVVRMAVDAPPSARRSLGLQIDGQPASPAIWDIPPTNGFEVLVVTGRPGADGTRARGGSPDGFLLPRGDHTLVLSDPGSGVGIDKILIEQATRIRESFTVPEPSSFSQLGGRWRSSGGLYELVEPGAGGLLPSRALHERPIAAPFTLTAKVRGVGAAGNDGQAALVFGYQDAGNFHFVRFAGGAAPADAPGLFRVRGGVASRLGTIAAPSDVDRWCIIEIKRGHERIEVLRNGFSVVSASDASFSGGRVGFAAQGGRALFDDLVVE